MSIPKVRVPVLLDKPRTIVLDINALCRVEEVTGISMLVGQPAFSSLRIMRALIWAGLLHEDQTLTLERVGELIGEADTSDLLTSIMKAYDVAMPDPDNEASESDPTKPQAGATYGPSPDTTSD